MLIEVRDLMMPLPQNTKTSMEGVDVYLASKSTHSNHDVWLIDSSASFQMSPENERFCEYETYNGSDVFLGHDSIAKIIWRGRVKPLFKDRRIRTLPRVLYIPNMAKNLIYVSKMSESSVHIVFEKETCKMVREAMVLMSGVCIGTLCKSLGSVIHRVALVEFEDEPPKTK
jgi:hypothetical protein